MATLLSTSWTIDVGAIWWINLNHSVNGRKKHTDLRFGIAIVSMQQGYSRQCHTISTFSAVAGLLVKCCPKTTDCNVCIYELVAGSVVTVLLVIIWTNSSDSWDDVILNMFQPIVCYDVFAPTRRIVEIIICTWQRCCTVQKNGLCIAVQSAMYVTIVLSVCHTCAYFNG